MSMWVPEEQRRPDRSRPPRHGSASARTDVSTPLIRRLRWMCLVTGVAIAVTAGAQTPAAPQAPRQAFRVSVNYVDVDVTVTDGNGHFVSGLGRDDFEVFEDGKPQRISTFSLVELPRERPDRLLMRGKPVSSDVRSNRDAASGRVYIIVLDDLDVNPMRSAPVRAYAREFIEKYFGPHDLAAVVSTSGRKEAGQEFTNDSALLLRAVNSFIGLRLQSAEVQRIDDYYTAQALAGLDQQTQTGKAPEDETTIPNLLTRIADFDPANLERGQRATGVLNTLRSLTEFLEGVPGRRKALLWFSEGIDYPMAETFSSPSGNEIIDATKEAIRSAARANVNVFALDPRGLIGMTTDFIDMTKAGAPDTMGIDPTKPIGSPFGGTQALINEMRLTQDSLQTLADGTGGFAAVDTNSFKDAFDRIVETNSRYYLLGYVPPNHPRDGRFHRIDVRVKRPGLRAVARRGYPSPGGAKTVAERKQDALDRWAQKNRAGGSGDTSVELLAALNNPVQQPGITLTAQAVPFRGTSGQEASVALAVEIQGRNLEFTPQPSALVADTVELSFFALNDDSKAQRGTRSAINLAIRPETYERVKALGIRFNTRTPMAPGRYQLRVGARDVTGGNTGTVFYDLTVPDYTKVPLMMSPLLLSSTRAAQVLTVQHDPLAEQRLGAPPSVNREFTTTETLAIMTEIYDNAPSTTARAITVRVGLTDELGRDMYATSEVVPNGAGAAAPWTALAYRAQIPLVAIAPGRYLLHVDAASTARGGTTTSAQTVIVVAR